MNGERGCSSVLLSAPLSHSAAPSFLADAAQAVSYIRRKATAGRRKTTRQLAKQGAKRGARSPGFPLHANSSHLPTCPRARISPSTTPTVRRRCVFLPFFFFTMPLHQLAQGAERCAWCVARVSHGAAYLLIRISISLCSLCVCLSQQPVKDGGWLAGWLAASSLCGLFVC